MAQALAAMCPPLSTADVVQAANKLAEHGTPTRVIGQLLHQQADLRSVRQVVEALQALRELQC
jgi:hypothetical protein